MELLPGLEERLAASVISGCSYLECAKNDVIIAAGSLPSGIHIVKQGLVGYYGMDGGHEVLVAPLVAGYVFQTRLNRADPVNGAFKALSACRILQLPEERFQDLLADREFVHWCGVNQHRNQKLFASVSVAASRKSTERKILSFVESYLQAVHSRPLGTKETAEWLLTQSHLSDMLGITRTHLNARLATLAKSGILDIRRRQIAWNRRPIDPAQQ